MLKITKNYLSGVKIKDLINEYKINQKELKIYSSPTKKQINDIGLEVHYMSYYRYWSLKKIFIMQVKILISKLLKRGHLEVTLNIVIR